MLELETTTRQCFVSEDLYSESELIQCHTTWQWLHPSKIDTFVSIMTNKYGWSKEESEDVKSQLINQSTKK